MYSKIKLIKGGGIFYGWILVLFLLIIYGIQIGFVFFSPAIIFPFMIDEIGWSRGEIMLGLTMTLLMFGVASPLSAWMVGRSGARVTLFAGGLLISIATLLIGLVGHYYAIYLLLMSFVGLGFSFATTIPIQTTLVYWFEKRRGLVLGIVMSGGSIGGFIAPQIVNATVIATDGKWYTGWLIIAFASAIATIIALLTVRNHPADVGQYRYGSTRDKEGASTIIPVGANHNYHTGLQETLKKVFKARAFWFLMIGVAGGYFLWQVISTHSPLHLQDRGLDPQYTALFYSLAIGLSICGRIAIGVTADIIQVRYLFMISLICLLFGGAFFWLASVDDIWMAYLYSLLAGFGIGGIIVCTPTLISSYWGIGTFTSINAMVVTTVALSQAIAAPFAGFLYDLSGTYITIMAIAWAGAVIGSIVMLFCRPPVTVSRQGQPRYADTFI